MNYDDLIIADGRKKEDLLREIQEKLYRLMSVELKAARAQALQARHHRSAIVQR